MNGALMRTIAVAGHALVVLSLAGHVACSSDDSTTAPPTTADAGGSSDSGGGEDGGATDTGTAADSGGTADAGKKPFGESCGGDGECESGHCFVGGAQAFCTFT